MGIDPIMMAKINRLAKDGVPGADGKSAYQYAVEGGYTGTEEEFAAKLAAEKFANPNALTFTGAVTGSYDGSAPLSVEIPSGGGVAEWKLIGTVTLSEAVREVTISKDSDGNQFAFQEIFVRQNVSCAESSRQNETIYINSGKPVIGKMPIIKNTGYFGWSDITMNITAGKVVAKVVYSDATVNTAGAYNVNLGYENTQQAYYQVSYLSVDSIQEIKFSCTDRSKTFAENSSFTIWGR